MSALKAYARLDRLVGLTPLAVLEDMAGAEIGQAWVDLVVDLHAERRGA